MRCLLIGNYGVGNLGDEALKEYFLRTFPDVEWQVLSARPGAGEFARLPAGLRSFFGLRWIATLRAFRQCDRVVFGGGSLFTDVESPFACFLWWLHARVAQFYRKPIALCFQGIGPFTTRRGERLARKAVAMASFVSVRDRFSAERIASWTVQAPPVVSFDPVFALLCAQRVTPHPGRTLLIIPRHNSGEALISRARQLLAGAPFDRVVLLSMQPDDPQERAVLRDLGAALGQPSDVVEARTLRALLDAVSGAALVLAQRYHGAMAAIAATVPVEILTQGNDDKLASLRDAGGSASPRERLLELVETGEQAFRVFLFPPL